MFQFIHAADVHLDSPLRGLTRYETAPVEAIRGATRRALEALVDLALEEQVAFVLLAELAKRTQVLLFTHHGAVVDQGAALSCEAGVFVHRL